MSIKERYTPIQVGVNASVVFGASQIAGFLPITTGTLTILDAAGNTIINAVPVTAGIYLPMPFLVSSKGAPGGTATTGSGASGVLGV